MIRSVFLIAFFIFFTGGVNFFSQGELKLNISFVGDEAAEKYTQLHLDSMSLERELESYLFLIQTKGYIESRIVNKEWSDNGCRVKIYLGEVFEWGELSFNAVLLDFYRTIKVSEAFNPQEVVGEFDDVLTYCENNGYPFASMQFDNILVENNKISARASLVLNDYVLIDSVVIKGGAKTDRFVVYREIGIFPGEVYDESEIKRIAERVKRSSFLDFIRFSEISFTKGKALVTVFIKDKLNNQFGGIIGVNSDDVTGGLVFSGDVDLRLNNALKVGDNFVLNWRKTKKNTQNFLISSSFPYMFRTRFGTKMELTNLRRDTSFSNVGIKAGLSYQIQNNQGISVFIKNSKSNSLLEESSSTVVPLINSVTTFYYGVEFNLNTLDYLYNPRKGFFIEGEVSSGTKRINKSQKIVSEEYQNLQEKSIQYELRINMEKYFAIFKRSAVLLRATSAYIVNDNIFENEFFQIGGLKSLRGFNEQSILASSYSIGTVEYRFLFDKKSAFFTFLDYAYYESKGANYISDSPMGIGFGVNLGVKSGVFTLGYALGKQQGNPILIKNSKVHFGFISVF